VAKEEKLHVTVAGAQLEHEKTDQNAQAAVDASRDQRRRCGIQKVHQAAIGVPE
jgi:hypothetical protein